MNSVLSHALTVDEVATANAPRREIVYAPLWRRFLAALLDVALVTTVALPLVWLLSWGLENSYSTLRMSERHARYLSGLSSVLLWVIADGHYQAKMVSSRWQATLGKKLLRLRVLDADGGSIGYLQACARHYIKYLSLFPLGAGFWVARFSPQRQAMHDAVTNTIVVRV
jgi:uncharacterized RDD family membrane protein YckC